MAWSDQSEKIRTPWGARAGNFRIPLEPLATEQNRRSKTEPTLDGINLASTSRISVNRSSAPQKGAPPPPKPSGPCSPWFNYFRSVKAFSNTVPLKNFPSRGKKYILRLNSPRNRFPRCPCCTTDMTAADTAESWHFMAASMSGGCWR